MHRDPHDLPSHPPLLTPRRAAVAFLVLGAAALIAYLLAFGGIRLIGRWLGFSPGPNQGAAAGGPPPTTICGRDLAELKAATLGTYGVLGEIPAPAAVFEAQGLPRVDPWGNPYRMHIAPGPAGVRQFWFSSDGPDGMPDTPDDIATAPAP